MSLNQAELNALAAIRSGLQREDPALTAAFDSLHRRRPAVWWTTSALTIATIVAVWVVGPSALALVAMLLVLASPVAAILAAECTAELRPDDAVPVAAVPAPNTGRRASRHPPTIPL